ncbi:MAG: substrate-binding protein [Desulfovibrionaceae bacterium]
MLRRVAASLAVAGLLLMAPCVALGAQQGAVLLGMNYPLTGPYSVEGLDQIRAARMAVDEINALGGIMGRRVRLVVRDSFSDVVTSRMNVEDLIDQGCRMIFGGSSSDVAIAVSEICQRRKVLFFGTLTYATQTTLENGHRYTFRECNDSWMSAKVMAEWLNVRYKGKKFFYITADYSWGWATEQSLRVVTGTQDRSVYPGLLTPLGATDFRPALAVVKEHRPDVLVLCLFGKDMAYALQQATAMGLKRYSRIVVPNITLGMAERAGLDAMEGVVGTVPWTWKVPYVYDYPRGRAFVEAFAQRFRRYPSTSGASAYTIVYEFKAAVERAGSFAPADLVRALEGHDYMLLKDRQTWRALDHQSVQTVYLVQGADKLTVLSTPLRLDYFSIIGRKSGEDIVRTPEEWRQLRREAGLPPNLEDVETDP